MVSFNTLRNTVVASALGLATTLGGCAVKQSKPLLRNPNQLEPRMKEKINCIIDEGTVNNEASTLIKVENDQIIILRAGSIAKKLQEDIFK